MHRAVFASLVLCVSLAFVGIAALESGHSWVSAQESTAPPATATPEPITATPTPAPSTPAPATAPAPAPATTPTPAALPDVVARVGERVVTGAQFQQDLLYRWKRAELETGTHVEPTKEFRAQVLSELIDGLVLQQLASSANITISDAQIEEQFALGKERLGSEEAFQDYLKRSGMSEAALREEIRLRLLTEEYVKTQIKDISTTDTELMETYPVWKGAGLLYRAEPTADVARIMVIPTEDTEAAWEAAQKRIAAIRERIVAGEDFETVAEELAKDDDPLTSGAVYLGSAAGRVPPEIDKLMFEQGLGEVSEPFRGKSGWQIIQVAARHEAGDMSFEAAKDLMRTQIQAQKITDALKALITKTKSEMKIEIVANAADAVEMSEESHSTATPPGAAEPQVPAAKAESGSS